VLAPPRPITIYILWAALLLASATLLDRQVAQAQQRQVPQPWSAATYQVYLPLLVAPAPPPSSEQLIDAALARGEIDEETALVYKVFADFGDERLPQQYRGDDSQVRDAMIVSEAGMRFDSLSTQTQAILAPFLLPPSAPGSWLELREGAAQQSRTAAAPNAVIWHKAPAADNKAVIWWQDRYPGDVARANFIAQALSSKIWPELTILMGREPLSDLGRTNNGGDGRFDIYLVRQIPRMGGAPSYWPHCKEVPAYLLINSNYDGDELLSIVAHEFMHALQWTYRPQADCVFPGEYAWLVEATGAWAEDFVYPNAQEEQKYATHFLAVPDLSLEKPSLSAGKTRFYGAYLWPFYLSHRFVPAVVRSIWENTEKGDSLEAIDMSIPGGFERQWPEFTLYNLNRAPMDFYKQWDDLESRVASYPIDIDLEGAGDGRMPLPLPDGVEHLAAQYFHFTFPDANVRTVVFYNGYTFNLGEQQVMLDPFGPVGTTLVASPLPTEATRNAHVKALIKTAGHDWVVEDWTNRGLVRYCRDAPGEKLEELILIFSNSEHQDRQRVIRPAQLPPTLWVSSIGCWQWEGEINAVENVFDDGPLLTMKTQIRFQRIGSTAWPLAANVTGEWLTHDQYEPQGVLDWQFSGVDAGGCTWSGSGSMLLTRENSYLDIATYATSGQLHRSYQGYGETDPLIVIGQRSCPDGTGGPYGWTTWWFPAWSWGDHPLHNRQGGFDPFHVTMNGAIDDARNYHSGAGGVHADWQLSAQSSP
jgi:hypothetical protein